MKNLNAGEVCMIIVKNHITGEVCMIKVENHIAGEVWRVVVKKPFVLLKILRSRDYLILCSRL